MSRSGFTIRTALILLFALAANSHAEYSGGFGTAAEPYEIGTVTDWQDLMDTPGNWDKHFILTADLDVNGIVLSPVGNDANNFTGIFDGNDHIIGNAGINMPDSDYVGLFGYVGQNGHVANLGGENLTMKGRNCVGGLMGYNIGGNVAGCYTTGSVGGASKVGGLIGYDNDGILIACYSTASVIGSADYIGGLVAYSDSDTLNACHAAGEVTGNYRVGGLVGMNGGTATACYATGAVTGEKRVGGLAGENRVYISYCYSTGLVSGSNYVGGLIGDGYNGGNYACFWDEDTSGWTTSHGGEGKTTADMQDPNTFLSAGWDFTDQDGDRADWFVAENDYPRLTSSSWVWSKVPDFTGMSLQDAAGAIADAGLLVGSSEWVVSGTVPPGHIVRHYPMAGFKGAEGVTEVDLIISRATEFSEGDGSEDDPYHIRTAAEWAMLTEHGGFWDDHLILVADIDFAGATVRPIGGYDGHSDFTGFMDGNGHIISNLRITLPYTRYVGLFGQVAYPGRINNLGVKNASITGREYVGGMVGYLVNGSINGCYLTGDVSGYDYVGGLVGGTGQFGTREVSGCYAAVTVSGNRYVGGLAGDNRSTLRSCYSRGPVSGNSDVGGLVGYSPYGTGIACFWDVNTSCQSASDAGAGKTTAEMKDIRTYADPSWDFITEDHDPADWVMPENDYPRLGCEYWENARIPDVNGMTFEEAAAAVKDAGFFVGSLSGTVSGTVPVGCVVQQFPVPDSNGIQGYTRVDMVISYRNEFEEGNGSEENPYKIGSVCDWILLTDSPASWSAHFHLIADLDLYGGEVPPVGYDTPGFAGIFGGNNHIIRNVVINMAERRILGLFSYLRPTAQIHNIAAQDVHIMGGDDMTGSIGGLVGASSGTITNCNASGWVESDAPNAGGLVGHNAGSITGSHAATVITGGSVVGGLTGRNQASITDCYAIGNIGEGGHAAGGLVGSNSGNIIDCYAEVDASGYYSVGGLVGYNNGNTRNCYANGDVSGYSQVGGLVGKNTNSITNCYSTGQVGAEAYIGGLVGRNSSGTVTAGFWDTDTSGVTTSAGGERKTTGEMQDPNTFISAGWDFVAESANGTEDIWSICEGTNYPRLTRQIPAADWVCPDGVGMEDFGHFGGFWGAGESGPINLDGEDGIGFGDLTVFCQEWLVGR